MNTTAALIAARSNANRSPNNFTFQQRPANPALNNAMQTAQQQAMAARQAMSPSTSQALNAIGSIYGQMQAGNYNPAPNNFTFQQRPANSSLNNAMQAAQQQAIAARQQPSTPSISQALDSIGAIYGEMQAGNYNPAPNNFTFQQQPANPSANNAMQAAQQQARQSQGNFNALRDAWDSGSQRNAAPNNFTFQQRPANSSLNNVMQAAQQQARQSQGNLEMQQASKSRLRFF